MEEYTKKIVKTLFLIFLFVIGLNNKVLASGTTWNPNDRASGVVLSNNNLTVTTNGNIWNGIKANKSIPQGKWYFEVYYEKNLYQLVGIAAKEANVNISMSSLIPTTGLRTYEAYRGIKQNDEGWGNAYTVADTSSKIYIGVAIDRDNGTIRFFKNGVDQGIAFSDLNKYPDIYPFMGVNGVTTANFGASPFKYAPPEGYLPLDSSDSNSLTVLNVEPERTKIKKGETVSANLTIDNITDIAAEDVRIKYDNTKLQFLGVDEVEGIKLVKQSDSQPGELRFIVASKGEKNIANAKKVLLKLKFKGIAKGEALVDVTKGRVSDGIEMEKDLTDEQCGEAKILIEELKDVNNSGEFTLLDLAIDARHMGKDPKSAELAKYNTDIVPNNAIDDADLLEIGKLMLENPNYKF